VLANKGAGGLIPKKPMAKSRNIELCLPIIPPIDSQIEDICHSPCHQIISISSDFLSRYINRQEDRVNVISCLSRNSIDLNFAPEVYFDQDIQFNVKKLVYNIDRQQGAVITDYADLILS
jgi:hypothetical protein